jgi:ATP-dependent DNA ligase
MIVRRPSGFIAPCQPSKVARPPSGPLWVHEIKHDGYRLMVRRDEEKAAAQGWQATANSKQNCAT